MNSTLMYCLRFPQTTLFNNFFIKNGSHSTIYTFKNYFAIIFSRFQFLVISKQILNVSLFHTRARACIVNYYGPRPSTSKTLLVVMKNSKIVQSDLKETGCEIFTSWVWPSNILDF